MTACATTSPDCYATAWSNRISQDAAAQLQRVSTNGAISNLAVNAAVFRQGGITGPTVCEDIWFDTPVTCCVCRRPGAAQPERITLHQGKALERENWSPTVRAVSVSAWCM